MRRRLLSALVALAILTTWLPAGPALAASESTAAGNTSAHTIKVQSGGAVSRNVAPDASGHAYTKQYYYAQLDSVSKAVYDAILRSTLGQGPSTERITVNLADLPASNRTFTASFSVTKAPEGMTDEIDSAQCAQFCQNAIDPALTALMFDHSELSWLRNTEYGCSLAWNSSVSYNLAGMQPGETRVFDNCTLTCTALDFQITPLGYAWATRGWETQSGPDRYSYADTGNLAQITQAIAAAKAQIGDLSSLSTPQKIQAVHDWVCAHMDYADKSGELFVNEWRGYQTVFSALIERTTVCAGYCAAFKILCDEYDIPCVIIRGVDGEGDAHVWNYVLVDGQWYGVDCTWDDTEEQPVYDYFLRGSDSFLAAGVPGYHEERLLMDPYVFAYPVLAQQDYPGVTGSGLVQATPEPAPVPSPEPTMAPTPAATFGPTPLASPVFGPTLTPSPSAAPNETLFWPPLRPVANAAVDFGIAELPDGEGTYLTGLSAVAGSSRTTVAQLRRSLAVPAGMYALVTSSNGIEAPVDDLVATGQRVQVRRTSDASVAWTATIVVSGDVTGVGTVTLTQLVQMGRQLTRHATLEGPYLLAADVSGDGDVTLTDLVLEAAKLSASRIYAG